MSRAPSWRTIAAMEEARWRRFATAHAPASDICQRLATAHPSIPLSRAEVQLLAGEAARLGLPFTRAGSPQKRRRRRR